MTARKLTAVPSWRKRTRARLVASYADVAKHPRRRYEALVEKTESGRQCFACDENGTPAAYRLFP